MSRIEVDTARLPLLLGELRLPAISRLWPEITERSDREGWPAARLLATLAELETAQRAPRRIERHLAEARLPRTRHSTASTSPRPSAAHRGSPSPPPRCVRSCGFSYERSQPRPRSPSRGRR
jgi:hypothetical protein